MTLSRRSFLKRAAGAAGALAVAPLVAQAQPAPPVRMGAPAAPEVDEALDREHERILREVAIEHTALITALVRHSLISRDTAMAMIFKEG